MKPIYLDIANDFSKTPGARYRSDGPFSGQEFYEDYLLPKFKEANQACVKLEVNLNGVWGFPSSFVSESFGKLSLTYGPKKVLSRISFISDSETWEERIVNEIKSPKK